MASGGQNDVSAERLKELGAAFKACRQGRFTRAQAAKELGVSSKTIERIERGETPAHFGTLDRAAELFGVSLDELTGRTLLRPLAVPRESLEERVAGLEDRQAQGSALFGRLLDVLQRHGIETQSLRRPPGAS